MRRPAKLAAPFYALLVCALVCGACFCFTITPPSGHGTDFLPLYTAGKLLGTGDIYSPPRFYRQELAIAGYFGPNLLFARPPFVAMLAWPLSRFSWPRANTIWLALRLLALVGFVFLWPGSRRDALLVCVVWLPLAAAVANGQDSPLVLLWMAIAERYRSRHRILAGAAWSLCLAKFNLFLFLPVFLWVRRRNVFPAFAAGAALLFVASFAAGRDWFARYLAVVRLPQVLNPALMPNLHGLRLPLPVELTLMTAVLIGSLAAIRYLREPWAYAAMLAGSVLLSYHCYLADLTVLLPAVLMVWGERTRETVPAFGGSAASDAV